MNKNERFLALEILTSLFKNHSSLVHLFAAHPKLSSFSKEICFGVCRYFFQLEAIANSLLKKKPKSNEVWITILIGLYQIYFMRQPEYASVKETVQLLELSQKNWAKSLVNAVLRNAIRNKSQLHLKLMAQLQYKWNHPTWLIEKIQKRWPECWQTILKENDKHPPMTLRVNRLKTTPKHYLELLKEQQLFGTIHPSAKEAIILEQPCPIDKLPGFSEGLISIQDAAAQLAVDLLDIKPNMTVLDACCAPGGKTCHILERYPEVQFCTALDMDKARQQKTKENLKRLKLNADVIVGSALEPQSWYNGKQYDRILLDAPCSATGVIRRHPDIKWLRRPNEINPIKILQQKLLEQLWALLLPGGLMIYATCSILPEENEEQVAKFISKHPDCNYLFINSDWGTATEHGRQILPGDQNMDGFFYSVLKKEVL